MEVGFLTLDSTKKPSPEMARSVGRWVPLSEPCEKSVRVDLMAVPPIENWMGLMPPKSPPPPVVPGAPAESCWVRTSSNWTRVWRKPVTVEPVRLPARALSQVSMALMLLVAVIRTSDMQEALLS
ncbi:hypothetical protein D3C87_1594970 [compost metagenome]